MFCKKNFFTQHLRDVRESYFVHARHALHYSMNLMFASLASFIHALLPFLFTTKASSTMRRLFCEISQRLQSSELENNIKIRIAIIGFGASGVASFLNLVKFFDNSKTQLIIDIFDSNSFSGKGIAYSTRNFNHLLNVEAAKMSLDANSPNDFLDWLKENNYSYQASDFAPRLLYGLYLEDTIAKTCKLAESKGIKYNFIHQKITKIDKFNQHFYFNNQIYKHCILATGVELKNSEKNFWNDNLEKYLSDSEIHIAGTGLTAFDAIISLIDRNYQGQIFAYSRSGLITQERTNYNLPSKAPISIEDTNLKLSQIYRKFVQACKESDNWESVVDSVRLMTQEFWLKLDSEKKKRFMRHCIKQWTIHRHRCPSKQFEKILDLTQQNQLFFVKGKIPQKKFINCTGFDFSFNSELFQNMAENSLINYDELKMGIVSNNKNLHIIGSPNFGRILETTAIPDISKQAFQTAKQIYQ